MSVNDEVILRQLVSRMNQQVNPSVAEEDFFELFAAEQVLREYELSNDELKNGRVAGGNDGGMDTIHIFINNHLLTDETNTSAFKRDVTFDIYIIQAKRENGFGEDVIDKFKSSAENLFNLTEPLERLRARYNDDVLRHIGNFRSAHDNLATFIPSLKFHYVYASYGADVHPNTSGKVNELRSVLNSLFSTCSFDFQFIGARGLLERARKPIRTTTELAYEASAAVADGALVCLVRLRDYYEAVIGPDKEALEGIFDANVRDYEGDVNVNRGIRRSLESQAGAMDFWWLNNGITIIANRMNPRVKGATLEDMKVVNGLQTSMEIVRFFQANPNTPDDRYLLVKIVATEDERVRDDIIAATNSQTKIPHAWLHATEKIQRDIEAFLLENGYYYDRKKNYYKNLMKPRERIVSIRYLAQAVIAILLGFPDEARARPSTLLENEVQYPKVFSESHELGLYLSCLEVIRQVESAIKTSTDTEVTSHGNNIKWHAAYYTAAITVGETAPSGAQIAGLSGAIGSLRTGEALTRTVRVFSRLLSKDPLLLPDKLAKSETFVTKLKTDLARQLKK